MHSNCDSDNQGYCYCPFHHRFYDFYQKMGVKWVLQSLDVPSCKPTSNKPGRYNDGEALKQHCNDLGNWHHWLVLLFIRQLFEVEANPYPDDLKYLYPTSDQHDVSESTVNSLSSKTSVFHVKG